MTNCCRVISLSPRPSDAARPSGLHCLRKKSKKKCVILNYPKPKWCCRFTFPNTRLPVALERAADCSASPFFDQRSAVVGKKKNSPSLISLTKTWPVCVTENTQSNELVTNTLLEFLNSLVHFWFEYQGKCESRDFFFLFCRKTNASN